MRANRKPSTSSMVFRIILDPSTVATTSGKYFDLTALFSSEVMYKDSRGKKQWYDCNDSWVKAISQPDLESTSAYVLFYELSTSPTPYWIPSAPLANNDGKNNEEDNYYEREFRHNYEQKLK